jgi:hypothetical protein
LQVAPSAQTRPPLHALVATPAHVASVPVQWPAVRCAPTHATAHVETIGAKAHAPALQPSAHAPLPHRPFGSSAPSIDEQVPALPGRSHARQAPSHATSQQTPSAHAPLVHSAAAAQSAPFAFFATHALAAQYAAASQSVVVAHVDAQAVPDAVHAYGLHAFEDVGAQAPAPSHPLAGVSVPETQPAD